jgi:hypothetical protein
LSSSLQWLAFMLSFRLILLWAEGTAAPGDGGY